jgi:hypothetical protein
MADGHIYFHSPCFDGIASAVLSWDFLEARRGWTLPALRPVNYDRRETWLRSPLVQPCAVVDFLYHPAAQFWADHHLTAFLTDLARRHFEERRGPDLHYDARAGSCAMLLWEHLATAFGHRNPAYAELVQWAEKIDAARYVSVEEAMDSMAPAVRLNLSLAVVGAEGYCEDLVRAVRRQSLDEVADLPEARRRFRNARALSEVGLDRFRQRARLEADGIVVFDVDGEDALVNRYAPYHFFPEARYSAGIVHLKDGAKVTAMRNPWREFASVSLGRIAEALGGGGHQRVGSITLRGDEAAGARAVLEQLVKEIRSEEAKLRDKPPG